MLFQLFTAGPSSDTESPCESKNHWSVFSSNMMVTFIVIVDRKQAGLHVVSKIIFYILVSNVVLKESSCPPGSSRINCPWTSRPCLWTKSLCPQTTKSSKIVKDSAFCKQSVTYHVKSVSLVAATVHEVTMKNG